MRIAVLTTSYPRYRGDYAGLFVRGAARALAARGHHIEVLAPEPADPSESTPQRHPKMDVVHVPYARPRHLQQTFYGAGAPENIANAPWRVAGVATFAAALARQVHLRRGRWDAVMSHWAVPCGMVAAAAAPELPHLAVCHSADVHALTRPRLAPLNRQLRRRLVASGARFWFVSERHRQAFCRDTPLAAAANPSDELVASRLLVSSMGLSHLTPATAWPEARRRARAHWGMDRFTVLALGRLVPIKGLHDAVRAVAGLQQAELWLAGDGPERERLERMAKELGVTVRAPGIVSGRDKQRLLAGADVLIAPSLVLPDGRSEGVPTVIGEAQAAGLPVIASAVGGLTETLQHGRDAWLSAPGDPDGLCRTLTRLRDDPDLAERLRNGGWARARRLQWSTLAPTLERLLSPDGAQRRMA